MQCFLSSIIRQVCDEQLIIHQLEVDEVRKIMSSNDNGDLETSLLWALYGFIGIAIVALFTNLATFKYINDTYVPKGPFQILKIECLVTSFCQLGKIGVTWHRMKDASYLAVCAPSTAAIETNLAMLFGTRWFISRMRYKTMSDAQEGLITPASDADQYVFNYKVGLGISALWNSFVSFLDVYFEVYALPPNRACMNYTSGRTNLELLIGFLLCTPYVLVGIFTIIIDYQLYNLNVKDAVKTLVTTVTQKMRQARTSLFQQIPIRSLLISTLIVILACGRIISYNVISALGGIEIVYRVMLGIGYTFMTVDIFKIPVQLLWTFKKNTKNTKSTAEDKRKAVLAQAKEAKKERLALEENAANHM